MGDTKTLREIAVYLDGLDNRLDAAIVRNAANELEALRERVECAEEAEKAASRAYSDLRERVRAMEGAITEHNAQCRDACNRERCGYAHYPNRSCPSCPEDWVIALPDNPPG